MMLKSLVMDSNLFENGSTHIEGTEKPLKFFYV